VLQGIAFVSALLVGVFVFGNFPFSRTLDYPLKFICIPFVVWMAFVMSPRASVLAVLVFAAVSIA
jgi:integral membrane sensor domain MASE1